MKYKIVPHFNHVISRSFEQRNCFRPRSNYVLFTCQSCVIMLSSALSGVFSVFTRETRECGPCWLFETKVNGDSKSTNELGPSLFGSLGLLCWYKRFFFCLGCSSSAQYKIFLSSPYTILIHLSPSPSKLGRQLRWVAYLFVCVSGFNKISEA